jgi:hypothetical protein
MGLVFREEAISGSSSTIEILFKDIGTEFICCANAPGAGADTPIGTIATGLKVATKIEMLYAYTTSSLME